MSHILRIFGDLLSKVKLSSRCLLTGLDVVVLQICILISPEQKPVLFRTVACILPGT